MEATNVIFAGTLCVATAAIFAESALIDAPGRAWGTVMAMAATVLSLNEIIGHLRNYSNPVQQRYAIRILLMVPIYAIDSLWGFFDRGHSGAIDLARDTYEAYVIYNFFHLLVAMNGGTSSTVAFWQSLKPPTMKHMFPLRGDMKLDLKALNLWKVFMMQYVIISPLLTLLTYYFTAQGEYDENTWSVTDAHIWFALVRCLSVTFAFTALLYLYFSTRDRIHDLGPTGKFLSIKAVIFLGCWQGMVVSVLETIGWFPEARVREFLFRQQDPIHPEAATAAFENWLVILEMFGAVIAHHFVFSYKGFQEGGGHGHGHSHGDAKPALRAGAAGGFLSPQGASASPARAVKAAVAPSFLENVAHAFSITDVLGQATEDTGAAARLISPTKKNK